MDQSPALGLPYILPNQAQKHVTHNEALRVLDAVVQIGVASRGETSPPPAPADGTRHIVAAPAAGAWAGQEEALAAFLDGAWHFFAPKAGWLAWVADEARLLVWDGAAWRVAASSDMATLFGVNTEPDAVNRLSVKSDGVLFSHDDVTPGSGGVRLTLNKQDAAATASVLFQSGYSGRAEFGLAGDDNWRVKVSADGVSWRPALAVDAATGHVAVGAAQPQGPLHAEGEDAALVLGNALHPAAIWSVAPGRPGFYEDHLIFAHGGDLSDPATHRMRLPKSAAPPSFPEGLAVSDGKRFASETSAALAHYIPFDGTRGQLAFRGADGGGTARFRLTAYYHDGAWHAATAGGWMVDAAGPRLGVGTDAPSATIHAEGPVRVGSFSVAALPDAVAVGAGAIVFVPDDIGGPALAFSDGTVWRRAADGTSIP
ncbi:DUF2793 domain-containing protein [Rhodosalinus sp. K401]|uniref:DUF2793 domain-containing protein n=1 Tax=Rhodosalinus sp. K401 TaxID=3239195 RepID=UPI003525E48F